MKFHLPLIALLPFISCPAKSIDLRVHISAGEIGIVDPIVMPQRYGIELQANPMSKWKVAPSLGHVWTRNEASFFYTDIKRYFLLQPNWYLAPSLGLGYFEQSSQLKLGHALEFRSGIESGFHFEGGIQLGIAAYHWSNSSLSDVNPGTESLVITLSAPVSF